MRDRSRRVAPGALAPGCALAASGRAGSYLGVLRISPPDEAPAMGSAVRRSSPPRWHQHDRRLVAGAPRRPRRPRGHRCRRSTECRSGPHHLARWIAEKPSDGSDDVDGWSVGGPARVDHQQRRHQDDDHADDREVVGPGAPRCCATVHGSPPATTARLSSIWMTMTPTTTSRAPGTITIATTSCTFGAARAA